MIASKRVSDYTLALASLNVGEAIAVGELLLNQKKQLIPIKVEFSDYIAVGENKSSGSLECATTPRSLSRVNSGAQKPK